ncbi:MAG TPA: 50S ribosomal protein L11 methyltransferase [Micropepsaceae bacterium]|nr:50S ribosomal protein L11 methyltransferase [Micropepsaceae bacterium]
MTAPPLWKASITLPKDQAPDVVALFELAPPTPQAVLVAEDPFGPEATVEALYPTTPDAQLLSRLVGRPVSVEPLPDQDWIRSSQEGLPPVRAGRFFVYGAHDEGKVPPGAIPIRIEAGLAFGTGHHETTTLCLLALSKIARATKPRSVLDLGCGTGVLAMAAAKLWRGRVMASDIDPIAIETAQANARENGVEPLIRFAVADGTSNPAIQAQAPYDLVVANILASPLTKFSSAIAALLEPGARLVLSGILRSQENLILSYYTAHGLKLSERLREGPWSALVLRRG